MKICKVTEQDNEIQLRDYEIWKVSWIIKARCQKRINSEDSQIELLYKWTKEWTLKVSKLNYYSKCQKKTVKILE